MSSTKSKEAMIKGKRTIYLVAVGALILLIGYTAWGFISDGAKSSTALEVRDLNISKDELIADGNDSSAVSFLVYDLENDAPARGVWVGLNIVNPQFASDRFSYFGWYSPEPNRSFYQTSSNGTISFIVKSDISGDIKYDIYAANPGQSQDGKYESLGKGFTLSFK